MRSKDADRITNREDTDQTEQSDLGLHCLLKPICPNISNYYGINVLADDQWLPFYVTFFSCYRHIMFSDLIVWLNKLGVNLGTIPIYLFIYNVF